MMIVRSVMLENYTDCPFYYEIVLQPQQIFKSVYWTGQWQNYKKCKSEMLSKYL